MLAQVRALPTERVETARAAGRVAAEDIRASVDLPPFRSSAMDGFAVRAADTPGELRVVGHAAAGRPAARVLGAGEAVQISTGAVVPDGADAVVPVERTTGEVTVERVVPGENVRPRAGDVRAGDVVVEAGTVLGPTHAAALAAVGVASVVCGRRPRAAVLATGTELRRPGEPLGAGEIYESNSVLIAAHLRSEGVQPTILDAVADDAAATRAALEGALADADVVITSGGVSVGPHDLVRGLLAELGVQEVLWRVAVKPGKPIAFGTRADTLVFGLPGNPVSSLVGLELFVRPALLALQGARDAAPRFLSGRLGARLERNPTRDELVRARLVDGWLEPIGGQGSHMIVRAASADALVLVPHGAGVLEQGAAVSWLPL